MRSGERGIGEDVFMRVWVGSAWRTLGRKKRTIGMGKGYDGGMYMAKNYNPFEQARKQPPILEAFR